eukprot:6185252-Pleurochrysis_carterae.AAC.3
MSVCSPQPSEWIESSKSCNEMLIRSPLYEYGVYCDSYCTDVLYSFVYQQVIHPKGTISSVSLPTPNQAKGGCDL